MFQVSNKKQRDTAALDAEIKASREKAEKGAREESVDTETPADILAQDEDEDVIF